MAREVEKLPSETLQQLEEVKQNNPQQYEEQIKQLIMENKPQVETRAYADNAE